MQKLLTELFWGNEELHHAAAERCKALPGYWDAQDILQLLDP